MVSTTKAAASDLEIFTKLSKESKKVKLKTGDVPFDKSITLYDISLKARGEREDEVFSKDAFLRSNVRRGLSYVKEDFRGATIIRRGLEKFFDLRHESINVLQGTRTLESSGLSWDDQRLYHVIFDGVLQNLKQGKKVVVYKTEKANGENAQISYNSKHQVWVIASKNVSMLIRNPKDVEEYRKYGDTRYAFAVLIADAWFEILKIKVPDVEALKKELDGKTLIGEYCGNPKHQHLVAYKEITIFFFALVELRGDRTCLPIHIMKNFVEKHGLPTVRMTPRRECNNTRDLAEILTELSKEVSENSIEEDQEGSVVYFEAKWEDKVEMLSLCKLKTLEYRLFRKLREKLKMVIAKGYSVSKQMDAYTREVEDLCNVYTPPKPLDYYFKVARIALEFVANNTGITKNIGLSSRFLDFLNIIRECERTGTKPEAEHFKKMLETANELSDFSDADEEDRKDQVEKDEAAGDKNKKESKGKQIVEEKNSKKKGKGGKKGKKNDDEDEEEDIVEDPKIERKKSRKSTDETFEEQKITTPVTSVNNGTPKRIAIIAPPLYFDFDLQSKLREKVNKAELETEWKDSTPLNKNKSISLLCKFPAIKDKAALETNTIFLIGGFDEDSYKSTLKKLESLAKEKNKFSFSGHEFTYINSKDKEKSLELLWNNHKKFIESINQLLPNNYQEVQLSKPDKILEEVDLAFEKLKNIQSTLKIEPNVPAESDPGTKPALVQKESKSKSKQVLAFIPIGIPGMGKTTFLTLLKQLLEEKGCAITIISSDKIRKKHLEEAMERTPDMTEQRAFEKSAKPAKKEFFEEVEKAIARTATLQQKTHIIFLDKNHPPNIIDETIESFQKPKYKTKYRMRTVVLKPSCATEFHMKTTTFPFSLTFLLTCIRRAVDRHEHETLKGTDLKIAGSTLR